MIMNKEKVFAILDKIPKFSRVDIIRKICIDNDFFTCGDNEEYSEMFDKAVEGKWYCAIFQISNCSIQDSEYVMDTVTKELLWYSTRYM